MTDVTLDDDEYNIPAKMFLERLRAILGDEAAVLWDELDVELDPNFRAAAPSLDGIDIIGMSSRRDTVRAVQFRGRMVAAWVHGRWIKRRDPLNADPIEADKTFIEFSRSVYRARTDGELLSRGDGVCP